MVLTDRGLISAEKGRGTFARSLGLTDSVFTVEQLMGGWLDDSAEVRLLSAATTRADGQVVAMLEIPAGSRVVHLRRLVLSDGKPAVYHVEYVVFDPRRPLVESQLQLTSWQGVLEAKRGQGFPRGEVALGAVALDADAAKVLAERPGTPALCMEHLFRDTERRPVSWGRFLLRGDLFRLRARLGPE
jgi:GntR family transcriptional regulator